MTSLRSQLQLAKPHSRWLGSAAAILGVSALIHLMVMLTTGGSWEGATSFRKPITFGVSVGLILWTCGWITDRLPSRRGLERILAVTLIGSGLLEVGLITLQTWRGVPSHFNVFSAGNSAIFTVMGISIGVFSVGLAGLLLWSLIQPPADRPTRLAIWAGMGLVMTGLGIGSWIVGLGLEMTQRLGHVPNTVLSGEAGVAKFPHAMALHGIQLFIGASILGRAVGLTDRTRLIVTRLMVGGYGSLVGWAIIHTNAGRAPLDLTGLETTLLMVGLLVLIGGGLAFIGGRRSTTAPSAATAPAATVDS